MANVICVYIHTHIYTSACKCTPCMFVLRVLQKKNTSKDLENLRMSAETDYILKFEVPLSLDQHLAK